MTTIRILDPAEVETAVDWAAREGWNPGLADASAFLAQDKTAFRGLFRDGALAAVISATAYAGGFAFVGFYICRPDLRGQGLGFALWQDTFAGLIPTAPVFDRYREGIAQTPRGLVSTGTVGLDGVLAQQDNYARSGFVLAHRNIRYGGTAPAGASDPRVVDIAPAHLDGVAALDAACFGFARPDFLNAWLAPPFGRACAFVAEGAVKGYGVIRRCREGHKIGPLFADDAAAAAALFGTLVATAQGGPVFLDVPEPNAAARALAAGAGLAPVFETARMYRGPAPELPLGRIFGITTFELG
ncbi:GNAT family N-acetyltransferase [Xanthobacter autotrophicus]|uniref:GNAT family N-acetyltransferase n=1 Tax=Xanthobacter autotrophicus TaxID=280 RepID=UPI0024A62BD0|nr:GNAT family N-acetyltransferase [Xanthobacter autotrophicus]MDI4658012.1 GNAT family N-acetyltransferase [Xanthobacter autotrophicus]